MRQFVETDFDKTYEELGQLNEKIRPVYSELKKVSEETFNRALVSISDITMDIPETIKEAYVSAINNIINTQGRLLGYLDDQIGKQVHHINLKSLGGNIRELNNFIVVYPQDHLALHKLLSDLLNSYLQEHPDESEHYAKARQEFSSATSVLALNSEMSPEEFIVDFYNMCKKQSLNSLVPQDAYSDRRKNYTAPIKSSGPTEPHKITLINFITNSECTEIFPDYDNPVILSINAASNFLGKSRKDIRTILVKNNRWIARGFTPFNWLADMDGYTWLIVESINNIRNI